MRRLICTFSLLLGVSVAGVLAQSTGEDAAREAVDRFGRALIGGEITRLEPILPGKGKVKLKLDRLGPAEGSFSASQVEALLREFVSAGRVRGFSVTRVVYDPHGVALATTHLELMDKQGRPASVSLHLSFHTEGDRWVVREIRESPR